MKQASNERLTIEIIGNRATVTAPSNLGNSNIKKTLKIDSLVKLFQQQGTGVETPILPMNTIKYKEKGNNIILTLYSPSTTFDAKYKDDIYENCIRPNILMVFEISGNAESGFTINRTRMYGVKEDSMFLTKKSLLYILPFPNIGDNGWICWGSNSISGNFKSLTGLGLFIDRMFNAPFNNDLFQGSLFRHVGFDTPAGLFTYLKDKQVWPNELFVMTSNRLTIESL